MGDAAGDSEDVAASGGSLWVIVVNTVVVRTQEGQVLDVGVATCLPGDDVVDLAVVGWFVAAGPCAGLGFSTEGEALFPAGVALEVVGVDGAFDGVDDGGVSDGGEFMGEEFRPGHARTIGELQLNLVTVAVDNLVEFVEGDDDLGVDGGFSAHTAGDDDGACGLEEIVFVDGFEGAADIGDDGGGVGNRDGVGALLAVGKPHTGFVFAFRPKLFEFLCGDVADFVGWCGGQPGTQVPGVEFFLDAGGVGLNQIEGG